LQHPQLKTNIVAVVARARAAGVNGFMCCGTSQADWEDVAYLAENISGVYPSFGLHPRLIESRHEIWSEKLVEYLVRFPQAGIGEIGLDHSMPPSTFPDQERSFSSQLRMAQQLMRPVSIWCQHAWDKLVELLDKIGPLPSGGVIRGYIGDGALVPELEQRGFCLSFTSWVCPWYNKEVHTAVTRVSSDRLLIESDTQTTAIPGIRGEPQEPAVLRDICETIGQLRGQPPEEIAALTSVNARRVFALGDQIQ
jgi:TatD DNase family protein